MSTCINNFVTTVVTGDNVTQTFTIDGATSTNAASYRVDIDGSLQTPNIDYTISGSEIIFTNAPGTNTRVTIIADSTDGTIFYDGEALQNISPNAPEVTTILKTECIGNSLATINNNFDNLRNSICTIDNFVAAENTRLDKLDTSLGGISTPQLAKAFVIFDATKDINGTTEASPTVTQRYPINKYNVSNVLRNGVGDYTVSFVTSAFTDNTYLMVGTTRRPCYVTYHSTALPSTGSIQINVVTPGNVPTDTNLVSLIFYK